MIIAITKKIKYANIVEKNITINKAGTNLLNRLS